jgi:hypothetical protein
VPIEDGTPAAHLTEHVLADGLELGAETGHVRLNRAQRRVLILDALVDLVARMGQPVAEEGEDPRLSRCELGHSAILFSTNRRHFCLGAFANRHQ